MFELKPIHREAIPNALKKAELYRLLSEPAQAESFCYDILQVDPENQRALITLLLALTDQFERGLPMNRSQELLSRLHGEYEQAYYAGIIYERKGRAQLNQGIPGAKLWPMSCFVKPCSGTRGPQPSAPRTTPTPRCAGTPALARSWTSAWNPGWKRSPS